jgi:hypothetical protein
MLLWTVSYAQTGSTEKTCYTTEELRKIAFKVVRASEFDRLEPLLNRKIQVQDSIITIQSNNLLVKDSIISLKDGIIQKKDTIISVKDLQIEDLNTQVTDSKKKLNLVKLGWATTTGILLSLLFLIAS